MLGVGRGANIQCLDRVRSPISLGVFYQAVTQHLGFPHYGDEYKVMGLAPYGEPAFLPAMRLIAPTRGNGGYGLDMQYFRHGKEQLGYTWRNQAPSVESLFGEKVNAILGAPRAASDPLEQRHKDVAQSLQARYEEIFLDLVRNLRNRTKLRTICLSGGCAANSVANGKVLSNSDFTDLYIPASTGDAGGAIGAASHAWVSLTGRRPSRVRDAYL